MEQKSAFSGPILRGQKEAELVKITLEIQIFIAKLYKERKCYQEQQKVVEALTVMWGKLNASLSKTAPTTLTQKIKTLELVKKEYGELSIDKTRTLPLQDRINSTAYLTQTDLLKNLKLKIQNTDLREPTTFGTILGNGAINWESDNKFIQN